MKHLLSIALFVLSATWLQELHAQVTYDTTIVYNDGRVMRVRITGNDTIVVASIPEVVIKSPPVFANDEQYRQYMRYRRYAVEVLPYAIEAIKLYRKYERETAGMNRGQAKRHAKQMQKTVKEDFTDHLKDLSRTQGKVLVKMIERHLDTEMYTVLRDVRGSFTATKWQTIGKLYGYDLKEGYMPGKDPILDLVLRDFEINVQ
jgi:hypothetical protein